MEKEDGIMKTRGLPYGVVLVLVLGAGLLLTAGCGGGDGNGGGEGAGEGGDPAEDLDMRGEDFECVLNWDKVGKYRITNKLGHLAEALQVARSPTGGAFPPGTIIQTLLDLTAFGSPSAIPVPDGESLTLWHAAPNNQVPGGNHYWTGSFSERNLCSGYSFLLSGGSLSALTSIGFNPAWEWSTGIGTIDATMTNIVSVGASGSSSHSASTQPFDQGTGSMTVSVTGTGLFSATTSSGEILGFNSYDESNAFGGSSRLVFTNLWGFTSDGSTHCLSGANPNPAAVTLGTGGPGGPMLSSLGNQPRVVAKLDTLALSLAANPIWTAATIHTTSAGGSNIPWFPAAAGISGSTGNGSGFAIPVPPLPSLVGITLFSSSVGLNASGTAIAALANNGHSHSNGTAATFFP